MLRSINKKWTGCFLNAKIKKAACPLLCSALLILSFPNFELSFLAWLAFVPILHTTKDSSLVKAFAVFYIAGLLFFGGALYWLTCVTKLGYFIFIAYLALYFGLFGALSRIFFGKFERSPFSFLLCLIIPSLWVLTEFLRGTLFTGFPWCFLGHSQYKHPLLIQIADITGAYGVSFLIMMGNFAVYSLTGLLGAVLGPLPHSGTVAKCPTLRHSERSPKGVAKNLDADEILRSAAGLPQDDKSGISQQSHSRGHLSVPYCVLLRDRSAFGPRTVPIIAFAVFFAICVFYGYFCLSGEESGDEIRLSVVQGSIEQFKKWDPLYEDYILNRYEALTFEAAKDRGDMIIWPETAIPGFLDEDKIQASLKKVCGGIESSLFAGALTYTEDARFSQWYHYFNSAALFAPDGSVYKKYNKIHLVPFGEYIPFEVRIPFFRGSINTEIGDCTPGSEWTIFNIMSKNGDMHKCGALICFEDIFPDIARRFAGRGADFLINITNDAWFGKSGEQLQHAQASVFRAVENRRSIVRAANNGLSCCISPKGIIEDYIGKDSGSIYDPGFKTFELKIKRSRTFYTAHGDIFVYVCLLIVLVCYFGMRRTYAVDKLLF